MDEDILGAALGSDESEALSTLKNLTIPETRISGAFLGLKGDSRARRHACLRMTTKLLGTSREPERHAS
jgi:hypothetical protein